MNTKTYTVVITGQQQHITGSTHEHISEAQLAEILNRYWDEDYPKPQPDGNSYELNGDRYITITKN